MSSIRFEVNHRPFQSGLVPDTWGNFEKLLRSLEAKGNCVPDAYHAALAIESGCDWITTDTRVLDLAS